MVTEKAVYIAGSNPLDADLPDGGDDSLSEADNHIRMLKSVIKNTFPLADVPLQVTAAQLNNAPSAFTVDDTGEYVVLTGPNYDYDTPEDKVLRLNSDNNIELVVEGSYPIGMVFWSMLTLTQMQVKYNKNGAVYVLANGGPVTTSQEYYKITNKTTVPNVMGSKYIRPTFLTRTGSGASEVKTLEPSEVAQTEATVPEAGFAIVFDTKTHRHNIRHDHQYYTQPNPNNAWYITNDGNNSTQADVPHYSGATVRTGESAMGMVDDPDHTHNFQFLNNVPGSNELNRITLNPFIRIN